MQGAHSGGPKRVARVGACARKLFRGGQVGKKATKLSKNPCLLRFALNILALSCGPRPL
jgi:hypothetical protein